MKAGLQADDLTPLVTGERPLANDTSLSLVLLGLKFIHELTSNISSR